MSATAPATSPMQESLGAITAILAGTHDAPADWSDREKLEAIHGWSSYGLPKSHRWPVKPETKEWGRNWPLYSDGSTEVSRIEVAEGGYCSMHRHCWKDNLFLVVSGCLYIAIRPIGPKNPGEVRQVHPGQTCLVLAGIWHRFVAPEKTVAMELYAQCRLMRGVEFGRPVSAGEGDIERIDRGGIAANWSEVLAS